MKSSSPTPGYTTREVAGLLGLPPRRVRAFVHDGFLQPRRGPRREFRFAFQDLVLLRAAQGLLEAGLPPRRVRRGLAALRRELPRGRPLTAVRITAEGGEIVVRDGREAWNPESGQRVFDFRVAELAAQATPLARRQARQARERGEDLGAEDWFALGLELEAVTPEEARTAYDRALRLDPDHADGHLNLGRLLHEAGEVAAAERHYRRALALAPRQATAAFNLGVALQDLGRPAEAVEAYRRAVEIDPAYADAYFNLAAVYEELGQKAVAIQNLKIYRSLVRG